MKQKMKSPLSVFVMVIGWLTILLMLSGCSGEVDRLWLDAPGWSRAALVDQTALNQTVPMVLDDDGGIILFSTREEGKAHLPHIIGLDRGGEVVWERTLDIPIEEPNDPKILRDGEELVLVWVDDRSLYATRIDISGDGAASPSLLSEELTVDAYEIAAAPDGEIVLWFGGTRSAPGVYMLTLGDQPGGPTLVESEGHHPSIQFDSEGNLHAAWFTYPTGQKNPHLNYAAYPGGVYQQDQQTLVTEVSIRLDSGLTGPQLGLDSQQVFLFWNEVVRSGDRMNKGNGFFLQFPTGKPDLATKPKLILVPQMMELPYEGPPDSGLETGPQVLLSSGGYPQVSPDEIVVNATADREIALGIRLLLPDPQLYMVSQLGTLFLHEDGEWGYQLLTVTPRSSLSPTLHSDGSGNFYLTWIERMVGSGYAVYFASTAPDIQEAFSILTDGDVNQMVGETTFGLLKGAVLAILSTPVWLILPGLLLALTWKLRERDESITRPVSLIILVLALAAFWGSKLATFKNVNTFAFVPFSTWIPVISASQAVLLQWGVPLLVFLIGIGVALYYAKRQSTPSTALFVVAYGVTDSLLTMAIYGELLISTF
jgi:hypothetical protein